MKKFIIIGMIVSAVLMTLVFQNCSKQYSQNYPTNVNTNQVNPNANFNTDEMNTKIMNLMANAGVPDTTPPGVFGGSTREASVMTCGLPVTLNPVFYCHFQVGSQNFQITGEDSKLVRDYLVFLGAPENDPAVMGSSYRYIRNLSCSKPTVPNAIAKCTYVK